MTSWQTEGGTLRSPAEYLDHQGDRNAAESSRVSVRGGNKSGLMQWFVIGSEEHDWAIVSGWRECWVWEWAGGELVTVLMEVTDDRT